MEQKSNRQDFISIDFSYIFRCLWKNALIIVMCACMAGVFSYIFLDNYQKDTYTASVNLAVVARDNSSGKLSEYNVGSAVTRCLNVLNSDTLREQVYKKDTDGKMSGSFTASSVPNTNIITMQATSASAESAFRLLKTAIEEYPSLAGYFESGYLVKTLDTFSASNISVTHPKTMFYSICAVLLVLLAGTGLTACMCLFTDKIHSKEQADAVLDMDILGVQHYVKKKSNQKAILVTDKATDISYMEEIDKLVTSVREKMDAHGHKTLMISSIKENEGKSTIAANIALSLVRRGKRVLLIDGDLRRPAVYKIFDFDGDESKQLSKYLDGTLKLEQVLMNDSANKGISFLLQKSAVGDPDKLLESEAFSSLLEQMRRYVDYIIIDTPPIGIVRDAEIVAGCADATMLILKQDNTKASEVNDVVDILEDAGTVVLGGVLTMAKGTEMANSQKSRYSKYYHAYGYGRE